MSSPLKPQGENVVITGRFGAPKRTVQATGDEIKGVLEMPKVQDIFSYITFGNFSGLATFLSPYIEAPHADIVLIYQQFETALEQFLQQFSPENVFPVGKKVLEKYLGVLHFLETFSFGEAVKSRAGAMVLKVEHLISHAVEESIDRDQFSRDRIPEAFTIALESYELISSIDRFKKTGESFIRLFNAQFVNLTAAGLANFDAQSLYQIIGSFSKSPTQKKLLESQLPFLLERLYNKISKYLNLPNGYNTQTRTGEIRALVKFAVYVLENFHVVIAPTKAEIASLDYWQSFERKYAHQ